MSDKLGVKLGLEGENDFKKALADNRKLKGLTDKLCNEEIRRVIDRLGENED